MDRGALGKESKRKGEAMNEVEQWAIAYIEDSARMHGVLAAYDALKDHLSSEDRETLLALARAAISGKWREKEQKPC